MGRKERQDFDQEFEDAIKNVLGDTRRGASDISNSALTLAIERSVDLNINPLVTQVVLLRLLKANIELQRSEITFPKRLQKIPSELTALTKCDNPFDLFLYFINKMFDNESLKKIDMHRGKSR